MTYIDHEGNEWIPVTGCPSCGTRRHGYEDVEMIDPVNFYGLLNAGLDLNAACSTRCQLQLDYAAQLATRDVVAIAEAITAAAGIEP